MGVNSLPKTDTRQRRGCDLNPGHSAPESSTLTTRLPSHPNMSNSHFEGYAGTFDPLNRHWYQRHPRPPAPPIFWFLHCPGRIKTAYRIVHRSQLFTVQSLDAANRNVSFSCFINRPSLFASRWRIALPTIINCDCRLLLFATKPTAHLTRHRLLLPVV